MSKYARRAKKQPVAQRATVDQLSRKSPPPEDLRTLATAKAVLDARHKVVSWAVIRWELGVNDRGTLSRVANGKREPTDKLCSKINSAYGCNVKPHPLHVTVAPLACGCPPVGKRCPVHQPKSTRRPDPVWRRKKVRNALWSVYAMS